MFYRLHAKAEQRTLLLAVFILAPTLLTVFQSLIHYDSFGLQTFGGVTNYAQLLSSAPFLQTLLNNLLWIIFVPAVTVIVGLFVATLADRLGPLREKLFKTLIFIPLIVHPHVYVISARASSSPVTPALTREVATMIALPG